MEDGGEKHGYFEFPRRGSFCPISVISRRPLPLLAKHSTGNPLQWVATMDQQEKDGWKRVVREVLQVRVCIHPYFQKDDLSVRELSTVIMDCVTQDNVTNIVFCLYVLLRDDLLCLSSVYPRGCRYSVATPLPSRFVDDCG